MSDPKNGSVKDFDFYSLGHKLKEHPSEKLGNFVLVAPMLRDSVYGVSMSQKVVEWSKTCIIKYCTNSSLSQLIIFKV